MESITEAVLRFQDTGEGYEHLVERISLIIYHYPEKIYILTEEDKCDFYLSFHSRIEGLIRNFTFQGLPFESLLNKTLKWHSRSFLSGRKDEQKLVAAELQEEEIKIRELLQPSSDERENELITVNLKNRTSRKRLLYLVLMDAPDLKDCEIDRFCEITGYDPQWVLEKRDLLRYRLHERGTRLKNLREKRNSAYMKMRYREFKLREETDREKRETLEFQIARLRKRIEETRYEISRVPARPTHTEIAEILDIPKGTVDSGIHYLRKKFQEADKEMSSGLFL